MAASPWPTLGRSLGRRLPQPARSYRRLPRAVKFQTPRSLNYARIHTELAEAVAQLPTEQQAQIIGTLPEMLIAYGLLKLGLPFQSQQSELGGRLRLGGGVVDFKVFFGGSIVIVRVQGDYWHSLPERQLKDAVQYDRLHRQGYYVWDAWEHDIYQAWATGRLTQFVAAGLQQAA